MSRSLRVSNWRLVALWLDFGIDGERFIQSLLSQFSPEPAPDQCCAMFIGKHISCILRFGRGERLVNLFPRKVCCEPFAHESWDHCSWLHILLARIMKPGSST